MMDLSGVTGGGVGGGRKIMMNESVKLNNRKGAVCWKKGWNVASEEKQGVQAVQPRGLAWLEEGWLGDG